MTSGRIPYLAQRELKRLEGATGVQLAFIFGSVAEEPTPPGGTSTSSSGTLGCALASDVVPVTRSLGRHVRRWPSRR